jgi:protein SCO1/2
MATATSEPAPERLAAPAARRAAWAFWLSALLIVALGVAAGLALARLWPAEPDFHGGVLSPPAELPYLDLQRAAGGRFSTADTRGRLSLFFFGYTTCPDVCPMALAEIAQVRRQLGERAGQVDVYFITVDPERDTPARLASYLANFDRGIVGLTGTPGELARARAAFGAVAQRREAPGSALGYLVDHSATLYLVDRQSRLRLVYPPQTAPADLAADIERLLAT